ncbi:hypothetical protein WKY82_00285 [Gordonia malaquae]|uniref:hypothetical protein n=1 Tax=Gordonia malaquae TaxID=410332 RepID=UPI0030C78822
MNHDFISVEEAIYLAVPYGAVSFVALLVFRDRKLEMLRYGFCKSFSVWSREFES